MFPNGQIHHYHWINGFHYYLSAKGTLTLHFVRFDAKKSIDINYTQQT